MPRIEPALLPVLDDLARGLRELGVPFGVVGALVPELLLDARPTRMTNDADVAVLMASPDDFESLNRGPLVGSLAVLALQDAGEDTVMVEEHLSRSYRVLSQSRRRAKERAGFSSPPSGRELVIPAALTRGSPRTRSSRSA